MTDALNGDFRIGRLGRIALELFRKIETHSFFKLSLLVEAFSAEIIITIVLTSTSSTLVMTGTVISILSILSYLIGAELIIVTKKEENITMLLMVVSLYFDF